MTETLPSANNTPDNNAWKDATKQNKIDMFFYDFPFFSKLSIFLTRKHFNRYDCSVSVVPARLKHAR